MIFVFKMKCSVTAFVVLFCFSLFVECLSDETGSACGFPGVSQNGILTFTHHGNVTRVNYFEVSGNESIRAIMWPVKTHVIYECEMAERFRLNGKKERICRPNGTWTEKLPFCDENVAYGMQVRIFNKKMRQNEMTSILTDGTTGRNGGIILDRNQLLILEFNHFLNISNVIIHGDVRNWEEIINPIILRDKENEAVCKISSNLNKKAVEWTCPDDEISTQSLTFLHYSKDTYPVMKIQVFVRSNTKCGYPEIPVNGYATLWPKNSSPELAHYRCHSRYELIGSGTRKCTSGIWSRQVPICQFNPTMVDPVSTKEPILVNKRPVNSTDHHDSKAPENENRSSKAKRTSEPLADKYIIVLSIFSFSWIRNSVLTA